MIVILNIETATKNCSVSLSKDGVLLSVKEVSSDQFSHAEQLHVFFEQILSDQGLGFKDLSAIGVSKGPGSYTGLRIGVSSAKGLCYSLGIPLIAVDTLSVLARGIQADEGFIVPMVDARRMEVYTAQFDHLYHCLSDASALVIEESSFSSLLDMKLPIHLMGDGALKCRNVLNNELFVYHEDVIYPSAKDMVLLTYDKFLQKNFVDIAYFEPFYLKDFLLIPSKKNKL